jgi:hypothetical protein
LADCPKPGGVAKKIKASIRSARHAIALALRDLSDLDDRAQFILSSAAVRKRERPHAAAALDHAN